MLDRLNRFTLTTYQNIDLDERNTFTLLYQPLIGANAYSLYLSLWSLIDRSRLKTPNYLHDMIYEMLNISPKAFIDSRKKLEALGLLVVYKKEDEYLYELKAPLTAEEFIKDGSLGGYLFNKVGQQNFDSLVSLFKITEIEKQGFQNVTISFDDVFESVSKRVDVKEKLLDRSKSKMSFTNDFDFEIFFEGLSKAFVDKRKITSRVKDAIKRVSYVYNLDEIDMQKVYMDAVTKDKDIDLALLSKSAAKWYQYENRTSKISLEEVKRTKNVEVKKSMDKNDVFEYLRTVHPIDLLENESGIKAASSELNVIENLLAKSTYGIEVINVLILYVLEVKGNAFPTYNYFEKIVSEWKRNDIETAEDALEYIKKRNKPKQKTVYKNNRKTLPEDIESDWLDDYINSL
ncbi:MAG: DnaD domain protein [Candidatus Izemoplasma sp.]